MKRPFVLPTVLDLIVPALSGGVTVLVRGSEGAMGREVIGVLDILLLLFCEEGGGEVVVVVVVSLTDNDTNPADSDFSPTSMNI